MRGVLGNRHSYRDPFHLQLLNYLKASGKPLGLLVNFKGKKATIWRLALEKGKAAA